MQSGFERFLHRSVRPLPLVFGAEQLGGFNWGAVDVAEVEAAVHEAVDAGVRIFDTADVYGLGESEKRLGRALRGRRNEVFIGTKFGVRHDANGRRFNDSSPGWCFEALSQSLDRLGTDRVDLYQLHCWDGVTPLASTFQALQSLERDGRVGSVGICNVSPAALSPADLRTCTTFSREFSLLRREYEAEARVAIDEGLCFIPYGVLGQGMLSGRYGHASVFDAGDRRSHPNYRNFHGSGLRHSMEVVPVLLACAEEINVPPVQLAIAWTRTRFKEVIPLVGLKSRAQLRDAVAAVRLEVPAEIRARLDAASSVLA